MLRDTAQRRIILEELRKCEHHPSADQLYHVVRTRLKRISLGTVYRNLELMAEAGLIQKLSNGGDQKRFDAEPEPHVHFRCVGCQKLEDVPIEVIVPVLSKENGWLINRMVLGSRLEYYGYCSNCFENTQR